MRRKRQQLNWAVPVSLFFLLLGSALLIYYLHEYASLRGAPGPAPTPLPTAHLDGHAPPAHASELNCNPPASGDWDITSDAVCENRTVVMNGNILVNASVQFYNTTIRFNCSSPGEYLLNVTPGGTFFITDGSNITNYDSSKANYFLFNVDGYLEMNDSGVHYAREIYLSSTSDATMRRSTISGNNRSGVYSNRSYAEIAGSNFSDEAYGVYNYYAGYSISGSNFSGLAYGIYNDHYNDSFLTQCQQITSPGTYYLVKSISFSGGTCCIDIRVDSVSVEGRGHSVTGNRAINSKGACATSRNNIEVSNLIINDTQVGIFLNRTNNSRLLGNGVSDNVVYGIYTAASSQNTIRNNTANDGGYGIYLDFYCDYNTLEDNTANSATNAGIEVVNSDYNNLTRNRADYGIEGIYIYNSSWNRLEGNNASSNAYGIYIYRSSNNNAVSWNRADNSTYAGIYAYQSDYNNFTNNTAGPDNQDGIYLYSSGYSIFLDNTVLNNTNNGFYLNPGANNNLTRNLACGNTNYDFQCSGSSDNNTGGNVYDTKSGCNITQTMNCSTALITNCTNITSSGSYQLGNNISFTGGICCINVTVNNVAIDGKGYKITGDNSTGSKGTCAVNRTNVSITNLTVDPVQFGIYFKNTSSSAMAGITASGNTYGIYLNRSTYINVSGCNASHNSDTGIYLDYSNNSFIGGSDASFNGVYGVALDGANNSITGSNLSFNLLGIWVAGVVNNVTWVTSGYNNITGNSLINNTYGIEIVSDYNNVTGNVVVNSSGYAISLTSYSHNWIADNEVLYSLENGIYVGPLATNNTVSNNAITGPTSETGNNCIYLLASNNSTLISNNVTSCGYGLFLSGNNNNVTNNSAASNGYGIYLTRYIINITDYDSYNNNLSGNNASGNSADGIWLEYSNFTVLLNNTASNNSNIGINLPRANNTNMSDNRACYNSYSDVICSGSSDNNTGGNIYDIISGCNITQTAPCGGASISNCTNITQSGYYYLSKNISFTGGVCCINVTADNVMVNGKGHKITGDNTTDSAGACAENVTNVTFTNLTIDPVSVGIYAVNMNDSFITYCNISGSENGIWFQSYCYNNLIANCNVSGSDNAGIWLQLSSYNNLTGNDASDTSDGYGFWIVTGSNYNILTGNTANRNVIGFDITSDYSTFTGNTANLNSYAGIELYDTHYNNLTGNNFSNNTNYGIYLTAFSDHNNFTGNDASSNNGTGIYMEPRSDYNALSGNNATDNDGYGVRLRNSSNSTLADNRACSNTFGDFLCAEDSDNNTGGNIYDTISGCNVTRTEPCATTPLSGCANITESGYYKLSQNVSFTGGICCINVTVDNVTLNGVGYKITGDGSQGSMGVCAEGRTNVTVTDVTVDPVDYGVYFKNTNSSSINSCSFSGNNQSGIYLFASNSNTISGNFMGSNNQTGITLANGSKLNNITGNTASNNSAGILLAEYCDNNTITGNDVSGSTRGIYLWSASFHPNNYNEINSNTLGSNIYGISILYSNSTNMTGNNITGSDSGISLVLSNDSYVAGNTIRDCGEGCAGISTQYCYNIAILGNRLSNLTGTGAAIDLSDSNYINVTGNNATDADYGVWVDNTNYSTVTGNDLSSGSEHGIQLFKAHSNTVENNTAQGYACGISVLAEGTYNNLTGNIASGNTYGIVLNGTTWDDNRVHHNNLTGNNATDNTRGMSLVHTNNNTLADNNILSNSYGVGVTNASANAFTDNFACSNTFFDFNCSGSSNNNTGANVYDTISGCNITQTYNCSGIGISDCQSIIAPGRYYLLQNISFSGGICCINATVDDILLDGKGHKITGDNSSGSMGTCADGRTNVTITNLVVDPVNYGVYFHNVNDSAVTYSNFSGNRYGAYLDSCDHTTFSDNTASSNSNDGVRLSGFTHGTVRRNRIDSNRNRGLVISGAFNLTLADNKADSNGQYGILINDSSSSSLTGNNASSNGADGIYLNSSDNNTLTGNKACYNSVTDFNCTGITSNTGPNIYDLAAGAGCNLSQSATCSGIQGILNCTTINSSGQYILGNNISFEGGTPSCCIQINASSVEIDGRGNWLACDHCDPLNNRKGICASDRNNITAFNISALNVTSGAYFHNTNNTRIANFTSVTHHAVTGNGVYFEYSYNLTVSGCNLTTWSNGYGIQLTSSGRANITNNLLHGGDSGIYASADWLNVTGNNVSTSGVTGIRVVGSHSRITGNMVTNSNPGMNVVGNNDTVTGNNISGNPGIGLTLSGTNNSVTGNILDGNIPNQGGPTMHVSGNLTNITGNSISGARDTGIELHEANNTRVTGNNISTEAGLGSGDGIYLTGSFKNVIAGNDISGSDAEYGVRLSSSNNNTIANNSVDDIGYGAAGTGIRLDSSRWNNVTNNSASQERRYGISMDSSDNNTISGNMANSSGGSASETGILLSDSDYNNLTSNNASGNDVYGIWLDTSTRNRLTSNNASDNGDHGLYLRSSSNYNILTGNIAGSNSGNGFYIDDSSSNNLTDNLACSNTRRDFNCTGTSNNNTGGNQYDTKSGCNITQTKDCSNITHITSCTSTYTINSTGYYVLDNNVSTSVDCIDIYSGANDSTLDCQGKHITVTLDDWKAIYVNAARVTVKNCNITSAGVSIYLNGAVNGTVKNNTATGGMYGIFVWSSSGNNFTSNKVCGNTNGNLTCSSSQRDGGSNICTQDSCGISCSSCP